MNTWRMSSQYFIWVGISFWSSKNSFVWDVDGTQLSNEVKSKWAPGNTHTGHCVVLSDDQEIWDTDCNDSYYGKFPFVCQKRLKPLPQGTRIDSISFINISGTLCILVSDSASSTSGIAVGVFIFILLAAVTIGAAVKYRDAFERSVRRTKVIGARYSSGQSLVDHQSQMVESSESRAV